MRAIAIARAIISALAFVLLASSSLARADSVQTSGAQSWPGRFQVGFHPFGIQVRMDGLSTGGYHMTADFQARVRELDKVTIWAGGGFNWANPSYSCGLNLTGCANDIQLWGFVAFTFEKLLHIPLVPLVRAGLAVDILPFGVAAGTLTGGALALKVGGGLHYWIIRHFGIGIESAFAFGPGFYPAAVIGGPSGTNTSVYANWDFLIGARAAF